MQIVIEIVIGFLMLALVAVICWAVLHANKVGRANLWLQIAIWAKANHETELFRQRRKKDLGTEWAAL